MLVKAHGGDFAEEFGFLLEGSKIRFMDGSVAKTSSSMQLSPVQKVVVRWMNRDARIRCDIADTATKKIEGLQNYTKLGANEGLYFPYSDYMNVTFHQGDVSFGLDLMFLRDSEVIQLQENTRVGSTEKWSCEACDGVIEVNASFCSNHSIRIGDKVLISAVSDTDIVEKKREKFEDSLGVAI